MSIKNKSHILKQITRLAYLSGIVFIISGMLLSMVSIPVFAKGNETGASLAFTSGCDGDCESITATVCNTGTEDMEEAVQWELYASSKGANQRTIVEGIGGNIKLDGKACTTLSVTPPAESGQYWFKAYQPEGHPGKGELFSAGCSIEACSVPEIQPEGPVVPTYEPTLQPTENPTTEPTLQPTENPTTEPTSQPTIDPTSEPKDPNIVAPSVKFTAPDTGICQYEPGDISATIVVTLPEGMTARLQAEYHIIHPKKTDHHYIDVGIVSNGDTYTYQGYWPGINPGDKIVEIHFGAALLDAVTGNPLGAFGSLDYYWYPYICTAPTLTPTPAIMQPLQISNQCTNNGIEWSLANSNPYPVDLEWNMNNGSLTGTAIVPASSSIQVNTSAVGPHVMYFYWEGPEFMYGYSTEISSVDSCFDDPAVTPTPTDEPGDPSPSPTPTDDPGDPSPSPTPTDDPGDSDPAPTSTPTDPAGGTGPSVTPTPTPVPGSGASLPVTSIEMSSQVLVDLAPLDPPMAVASAENVRVLIPVTGADVNSPLAGDINNFLVHLGLVFIGVALMTQSITKKFVES